VVLAACAIVAVGYVVLVSIPSYLGLDAATARLDAVLVVVSIAFIAGLAIAGWIGYSMATSPWPNPVEGNAAEKEAETKNKTKAEGETENNVVTT
jgi:arginine exporter protein ArgO